MQQAVSEFEKNIVQSVLVGGTLLDARFQNMTLEEIRQDFDAHREEQEKAVSIALIASVEATIRMDYLSRVKGKKEDEISREFRSLHKRRGERARLDEDLLEIWFQQRPNKTSVLRQFRGALKLRHWIAHGRFWTPKLGRNYSAENIFDIANEMFDVIIAG